MASPNHPLKYYIIYMKYMYIYMKFSKNKNFSFPHSDSIPMNAHMYAKFDRHGKF